jgi:RNA polymerase sigma-70 factor (sigma-E family)
MRLDEELAALVHARGAQLLRVAYQLTHDRGAAEDIVQEALFEVCRSWRRREGSPDNLEAYVRRAVVNEFLKKRRRIVADPTVSEGPVPRFDDSLAQRDTLWQALLTLSPKQRAVLVLRYYEDLPDQQIATILHCRRATVRSLAARGLAALRAANGAELAGVAADHSDGQESS